MSVVAAIPIESRWRLVRGNSLPRHLRHLLLIVMHYQRANDSAWCKRESLADELGIARDVVSQQMKELESLGVLNRVWKSRNNRPSREYSIQFSELQKHQRTLRDSSDYTLSDSSRCNGPTLSESSDSVLGMPQGQSEASLRHEVIIETINEESSSRQNRFADSDLQTAEFILKLILEMQPRRKKPDLRKWADTIRLMRERDKRTDSEIRDLFTWCNQDPFWRTNIVSPDKLRLKWDDLQLKCGQRLKTEASDDCPVVFQTVRETYHPDLRNADDLRRKLTPEQFEAAKTVGLSKIASCDPWDKATPEAYRAARKAVAS